ncbi:DUF2149 domain-containing protein [Zoogloea sp.]|uniref:DUF2149 domain-containing protein n=1 Tax=Zoogloea sp. TaxID=49181 RepID=UPI001AC783CE|nr:DUF2149 domain-containing protein [Zoogloea sp.]MBN8283311.1 DUF2149 domain-containing protein [Zoogloea sp.]HRH74552.1 hypothetical protein [Zoogloea sp.]
MNRIRQRLDDEGDDDPLLSLVNLIDVFLVLVAALLLAVARDPASGASRRVAEAKKVERFQGEGATTSVEGGVRAGTAYRLPDGSLVVVPE